MRAQGAAALIRRLAASGWVIVTHHAEVEMGNLGVLYDDLLHALAHARHARWQPATENRRVKGCDRLGVEMVIVVEILDSVIVVTVYD